MDLSPNDIRNYEFPNQMRGYDKEEVDSLLEQIASVLENMKQEQLKLSMENDSLKTQLDSLKQHEEVIKNVAIEARKNADATLIKAKEQATEMLETAKAEAQNLMQSHSTKIREYKNQFSQLEVAKNSFIVKVKELISSHMDLVEDIEQNKEQYEADLPFELDSDSDGGQEPVQMNEEEPVKEDPDNISVTDSAEVSRNGMETLATPAMKEQLVTEEANAADDNIEQQVAQAMADAEAAAEAPEEPSAQPPEAAPQSSELPPQPAPETSQPTQPAEQPQEPPAEKPVDPELASALENYQNLINKETPTTQPSPQPEPPKPETIVGGPSVPKQGEVVVTNKRAEDIPDGFIATKGQSAPTGDVTVDTDRIPVNDESPEPISDSEHAPDAQVDPTEHNEIDMDTPVIREKPKADTSGDNEIAKALDDVVAKFEEEMDKAEKSKSHNP